MNRRERRASAHKKMPKNNISEFRKQLFNGRGDNTKTIFRELHAMRDYQEMAAVAKYVAKSENTFHQFIFGIPFAKTYNRVRSNHYSVFTDNLQRDLDWISLSIVRYAEELSDIIKQTGAFQRAFLLGLYNEASEILESMKENYGLSLWVLEKELLLAEYAVGLESNKKLLSTIIGDKQNDAILNFLSEFLSLRCEIKLSEENYRLRLNRGLDFDGDFSQLKNYFRFRLQAIGMDIVSVATHITYFEGPSPIIDRYLTFIAILQACSISTPELKKVARDVIKRLEGVVKDSRIDALLQYFTPSRRLGENALGTSLIHILDSYTKGRYEESATAAAKLLLENPLQHELYYIYIRSLNYLGKEFTQIFSPASVAAQILEHCNTIIKGERGYRNSLDYILKLSLSLWRDPLAYGLYDIYCTEMMAEPDNVIHKLALLNATHYNPRFAAIFADSSSASEFLGELSKPSQSSSTIELMKARTVRHQHENDMELSQDIPDARRRIYSAEIFEAAGQPQNAISVLQPLLPSIAADDLMGGFHSYHRITRALFRCYLYTKELSACVDMVVRFYLRDERLTKKLPLHQLVNEINETSPADVMRRISYPILVSIVSTKAREVYVAYDNFLTSLGINRPTQIIGISEQFDAKELLEFLSKVCTIDVMACSYHFRGTKELEAERIRICQYLSEKDATKLKVYSDEISTITSRSLIRDGIRQMEASKIYVDEKGIRATGRKVLRENFARYRELAQMNNIESLQMLNTESLSLYVITADGLIRKAVSELGGAVAKRLWQKSNLCLIFMDFFNDVRDRFISSGEHGLDGYLSVRIRHGVLLNQIRSPFEALHLLSEKDAASGEYLSNPHWERRLDDVASDTRNEIQKHLAMFSRELDELALRLNKEMIQVKTEKKNASGLFDYVFSPVELYGMFKEEFADIVDYDQFMDGVFRSLWSRTQENLEVIRRAISVDLKVQIHDSISRLEREIRNSVAPYQAAELLQNIARSQTSLQYSLQSVAEWFTISRSSIVPQIGLSDLINICIESINNIYPHKRVRPDTNYEGAVNIDGSFFAPFFDIVRTLMDNVIVHSGITADKMKMQITAQAKDGRLTIYFKNNLGEKVRNLDPVQKLHAIHTSMTTSDIAEVVAKEGSTGLIKVRKLMAIDLQRKASELAFVYDPEGNFVVKIGMELEGLSK